MEWQVKRKSLNGTEHACVGYEEMHNNIRVYDELLCIDFSYLDLWWL